MARRSGKDQPRQDANPDSTIGRETVDDRPGENGRETSGEISVQRLVADISSTIVAASLETLDRAVEKSLERMGRFFRADRACLFRFSDDGKTMTNTHEWCAGGVEPQMDRITARPLSDYPWITGKIRRREIVHIPDTGNLPPEAAAERDEFKAQGIQSLLSLPLSHGGVVLGLLGFDLVRSRSRWSDDDISLMRVVGEIIAGAFVRARAEEELRITSIAFESQEGMMVTGPDGVIVRVNRAFSRLTGYSESEALGKTPALLRSGYHDDGFYRQMWQTLRDDGYWQGEIWNRRKDGSIYPEWLTISAVVTPDGTVTHYVGAFSDITRNKMAEAEIHRLAYYDPLTSLPNRRLLYDRLGQAAAASCRSGSYGALLFLDLDYFKTLNDTRGHDIGDRMLVEAARRIKTCIRASDTAARMGGDDFVVMLEDLGEAPEEAAVQSMAMGERIRKALNEPYDLDGHEYRGSVSIGITLFHDHDAPVEVLFKQADLAMYEAKNDGRNALRFFDPAMQTTLERRAGLEADLRKAIESGQFSLHYQAQMGGSCSVVGAEALLRWTHPERGQIPPDDFILLAEETGLIIAIGNWVLESSCETISAWSTDPETRDLKVAVNVSAHQFRQPDFVEIVESTLVRTGADPKRLKLELTESAFIADVQDTIDKMNSLRKVGIGFSMDDFGTGYSSLAYLASLPLEQVKIDRSFVLNLPDSTHDAIIIKTIITMGRSLGLCVIAEGVETEEQKDILGSLNCCCYQGYLFSRPLPLDEFDRFLKSA